MEHVVGTAAEMNIAKSVRTWIVSVEVNRLFLFIWLPLFLSQKKDRGHHFILYFARLHGFKSLCEEQSKSEKIDQLPDQNDYDWTERS